MTLVKDRKSMSEMRSANKKGNCVRRRACKRKRRSGNKTR